MVCINIMIGDVQDPFAHLKLRVVESFLATIDNIFKGSNAVKLEDIVKFQKEKLVQSISQFYASRDEASKHIEAYLLELFKGVNDHLTIKEYEEKAVLLGSGECLEFLIPYVAQK